MFGEGILWSAAPFVRHYILARSRVTSSSITRFTGAEEIAKERCVNKRIRAILGCAAGLALFAAAVPSPAPGPATKPSITIGKETTGITGPLLPNGMPDYLAALNGKYGKDVTPANNALIPFLQIRGTSATLTDTNRDKILKLTGAREDAPDARFFQPFAQYVRAYNIVLKDADITRQPASAVERLWMAPDNPELAEYLQTQSHFFDLAEEASKRSHFFVPFVSDDGSVSGAAVFSHTGIVEFARTWAARAMLRAGSGDFDGALRDIVALKRLARLLPQDGLVISTMLGYVMDRIANAGINTMAMSGNLTAEQCDLLTKAIQMPPLPSISDSLDTLERWRTLDMVITLSRRGVTPLIGDRPQDLLSEPGAIFLSIDLLKIDWDRALKLFNERRDAELAAMRQPAGTMRQAFADLTADRDAWKTEFKAHKERLEPLKDEAPSAYTARVVHGLMVSVVSLDLASRESDRLELTLRQEMLPLLLAAARVRATSGGWPKNPAELSAAGTKELPADPYAAGGGKIEYRLMDGKPRIFSVGPDQQAETADDIVVGDIPVPGVAPAAAPGVPAGLP